MQQLVPGSISWLHGESLVQIPAALIWFAFVGLAPADPALEAELERWYVRVLDWLASRLTGPDRRDRASVLFGAVDGITVQALAMPSVMTPARQRATLRLQLDAILGS